MLLLIFLSFQAMGQTTIYTQSFEDTLGYSFPNGNGVGASSQDFFDRTDSAGAPLPEIFPYTGFDSSYFIAAEDIDGFLSTSIGIVYIDNVDISRFDSLTLTAAFASGTDIDIDEAADSMSVQVKVDNGNWITIGRFEVDSATYTSSSGPFNGQFAEDTDGDGYGDGVRLTGTFADFTWNIPGNGDSLDIRIVVDLNSGDEEGAFDNIRVSGTLITDLVHLKRQESDIVLYPNPANQEVYVSAKNGNIFQIDVFDIKGRMVQSMNTNSILKRIDIANLERGMYIVRVFTDKGIENLKLQVE